MREIQISDEAYAAAEALGENYELSVEEVFSKLALAAHRDLEELRREVQKGLDQIERGETLPADEVFRMLRERRARRESA